MNNEEILAKCNRCGEEFITSRKRPTERICPKCGENNNLTLCQPSGQGIVPIKGSLDRKHIASWDGKSITILALIMAAILSPAAYGIFELLPLSPELRIVIWVVGVLVLGYIGFLQRYHVLMFIHWLDRKFTARKTYHDK